MLVAAMVAASTLGLPHDLSRPQCPASAGTAFAGESGAPSFLRSSTEDVPGQPTASGVDPYLLHTAEPAPLGIADYGVDAADRPYLYSTPSFAGQVQINSLSSYNATLGDARSIGFQLNVNVYLSGASSTYVYWVQDVASLNLSTDRVTFIDNVWNSSSPGAGLTRSSLSGNGTISTSGSSTFYYAFASPSLPGAQATLTFPTNLTMEVVATVTGGMPGVAFEYGDGFGWVTYDNVVFPSAAGFVDYGFLVDGFAYEPNGVFYDAELILGGPGGGSQTTISSTDVRLFLYYWNGHNFQEVVNAYNFGSDTAEGLNNGLSAGYFYLKNGSLFAKVTASTGSLGVLYDHTTIGVVNISTPVTSGELYINGTDYGPFSGNDVNITVGPGTYTFSIYLGGAFVASRSASVSGGAYLPLRIGFGALFTVTFTESGLPAGTSWSATIGATTLTSSAASIVFTEPNGTYSYTVGGVSGYSVTPRSGAVNVAGGDVAVALTWHQQQYVVTFLESGLPSGTSWSVTLEGVTLTSFTATIAFVETDGTYTYNVTGIPGYTTTPWRSTVQVSNANWTVPVTWSRVTYAAWFNESSSAIGDWSLVVESGGGVVVNITAPNPSEEVQLANGSYDFRITPPLGYAASPSSGSFTVSGGPRTITVSFVLANGFVSGTVSPTTASVLVGSVPATLTGGRFNVSEPAGRVAVEVTAAGFKAYFTNVTVVAFQTTWANASLLPVTGPATSQSSGLSPYLIPALAGVGAAAALVVGLLLIRRRRSPPAAARPPSGAT